MTVRHAGCASVRGKIRRVWRPRYLELLDGGHVQYYEMEEEEDVSASGDPNNNANNNANNNNNAWEEDPSLSRSTVRDTSTAAGSSSRTTSSRKSTTTAPAPPGPQRRHFKYRLQIIHARILDGTTLRDLHVGLPRGSYGWVFRARRLLSVTAADTAADTNAAPLVWQADPAKNERDFFCAVPSLEQAQMWVVALQWAAASSSSSSNSRSIPRHPRNPSSTPSTPTGQRLTDDFGVAAVDDWEHASKPSLPDQDAHADDNHHNTTHDYGDDSATIQTDDDGSLVSATSPQQFGILATPPRSSLLQQSPGPTRPTKAASAGTTVVAKVTGWQVVRGSQHKSTPWALAYRVQVLQCRTLSQQSWTIYRTTAAVQAMMQLLRQPEGHGKFPSVTVPVLSPHNPDFLQTWQWLDRLLQTLVTDALTLNTAAVKTFLGLSKAKRTPPEGPRSSSSSALLLPTLLHNVLHLTRPHDESQIYEKRQTAAAGPVATVVKEWLVDRPVPHAPPGWARTILWIQSYSSDVVWWAGGIGGTLALQVWWWSRSNRPDEPNLPNYASVTTTSTSVWSLPSLTLRLDVLVVSWVGAAYLGRLVWPEPRSNSARTPSRPRVSSRRRPKHNPATKGTESVAPHHEDGVLVEDEGDQVLTTSSLEDGVAQDEFDDDSFGDAADDSILDTDDAPADGRLSSPLPKYPANDRLSCWSQPPSDIFFVRSRTYLHDRVKEPSGEAPLICRGVDVWMTDNPERHIARHPAVLGGKLQDEDTFLVNFLLPFGNFVSYFAIPPLDQFPPKLRNVWTKFLQGDQQYRDARLKLLPIVAEGPWIVKAAVGPGKSPALLGKVIPLQYFFDGGQASTGRKAVYEVDVIITASTIAKGILSVVKGHTKSVSIAFAIIIEAAEEADLPETVLCTYQVHSLHLEDCPLLPPLDDNDASSV